MKMRSPIPKKHARIEIIPLIDIMFFLLASFMMVSLSQTHMKGIRVNLPSANSPPQQLNEKKDYVSIRVTEGGLIYFDNAPVLTDDVMPKLYQLHEQNPDVKVSLSAEALATHGDVINLLDKIRLAKISKIGYQIKTASAQGAPGTVPPAPGAPPPPPK
jgi:biopolymer transport protein ExbD